MISKTRTLFIELLSQQMKTTLIAVIVAAFVIVVFVVPTISANLQGHQERLAYSVSNQVETVLEGAEEHLKLIAYDISANSKNYADLSTQLTGFVQSSNMFSTVYIANKESQITAIGLPSTQASSRQLFIGLDISFNRLWGGESQSRLTSWSNIFVSPITGNRVVALKMPINSTTLVAEFEINRLPEIVQRMSLGAQQVIILDAQANIIAHPDIEMSLQQINMGFDPLFTQRNDQVRGGQFSWQQVDYQASIVPMDGIPWQAAVIEPIVSFNALVRNTIIIWLSVTLLASLLTVYFSYRSAKQLSTPFEKLKQLTLDISAGSYKGSTITSKIQEVNLLSSQINTMANQVEQRERDYETLTLELEDRVKQRTAEYESTNTELSESVLQLETTMDQLVQAEKLASLGSLVAGIAHELNTPIGNSKVAVSSQRYIIDSFLKDFQAGKVTKSRLDSFLAEVSETTEMSYRNLERAKELIQSFKQVAVDQTSSQQRVFNLKQVIEEVVVTLGPTVRRLPVYIQLNIDSKITMDSKPGGLMQVLTNVITNAVNHGMDGRASIDINIRGERSSEREILLEISDNGIGMSADHVKRAFDPFFTTKLGKGGSGLGLNIVNRMVVDVLEGTVVLISSLDEGTTVRLVLPIKLES
ncbi:ATP-binding protein [Reinekea sp.]|jgi:C4-dicarboxylate-specific signal transduction histidine kinase|uniref:sensor histidine kinase n=1 Tax=Reinekea sp. TaxID=1970455 RepID=UPI00398A4B03